MSYEDVMQSLVLFMREFDSKAKAKLRSMVIMSSDYDDRDKKFMIKTSLYDIFWKIPQAVDDGFNHYLNEKMEFYHHLSEYHKVNCNSLQGKPCNVCKIRINNFDLLSEEGIAA